MLQNMVNKHFNVSETDWDRSKVDRVVRYSGQGPEQENVVAMRLTTHETDL